MQWLLEFIDHLWFVLDESFNFCSAMFLCLLTSRFAAFIFSCNAYINGTDNPYGVRLLYKGGKETYLIPIHEPSGPSHDFTVCVPPLHSYEKYLQLVDFIETNSFFGANHFVIYNKSHTHEVGKYLKYYLQKGKVSVVPWHIPKEVKIHYHGQCAAILDCLYRSMKKSKYIVFMDLDEIIVPRKSATWSTIIERTTKPLHYQPGGYIFCCKFFQTCNNYTLSNELPLDIKGDAMRYNINSIIVRTSLKRRFKHRVRSKVLVNSQAVHLLNIHSVSKYFLNFGNVLVDPSEGLLHHYRHFDKLCEYGIEPNSYMDRFAKNITSRVKQVHKQVNQFLTKLSVG